MRLKTCDYSKFNGEKHNWFAWFPVETWDGGVVWLETVERQWTDINKWYACFEYWVKR